VLDMNLDRAERAEQRAADALALYQRIGDAKGTARVLDGRAMATFLDGQITRGTELLQRAANLFEDSGDLVHVITPRSTAGHGLVFGGDASAGLAHASSALELTRTLGHPEGETYALWHCAEAHAVLRHADEALAAGQDALATAQRLGHRGWTATAWRAVGIAQQSAGDLVAALHAFECSLETSQHLNLFASWAAARCALVLVALGRLDDAGPLVARALGDGPPLGHYEGRLAEVELAAAREDPKTAELALETLRRADGGGMRQGRERLVQLAES
jgi:tetratricopeptide (TPR) repeat protein